MQHQRDRLEPGYKHVHVYTVHCISGNIVGLTEDCSAVYYMSCSLSLTRRGCGYVTEGGDRAGGRGSVGSPESYTYSEGKK